MTTLSKSYLLTKVLTASHRELVLYLYEGAHSFIHRAIEARKREDAAAAGEAIDKVVSIVIELSCGLDYNRNGALALRLDSIYNYMIEVLSECNREGSLEPLETCESILTILADAWRQALESEATAEPEAERARLQISA